MTSRTNTAACGWTCRARCSTRTGGNQLYHQYLDQLEFADGLGFDGICVNEHHQNAYGLMPSPNLMGAALARRTSKAALVVMGNSIALYNPPIRVAEEFAMLDVMSGGRLVAGFPVGTSMDTNYCYGEPPATLRDKYDEAHRLIIQAWSRPGTVQLQRQVHPVALRQHLAAAPAAAAPADLDSRRRQHRDLGLLPAARLQLLQPQLLRLQAGAEGDGRLLGARRGARQGRQPVPRRLRADRLRGRQRPGSRAAVRAARRLLLQPLPARASGLRRRAGLPHHGHPAGRVHPAGRRHRLGGAPATGLEGLHQARLRGGRQRRHRARHPARGVHQTCASATPCCCARSATWATR